VRNRRGFLPVHGEHEKTRRGTSINKANRSPDVSDGLLNLDGRAFERFRKPQSDAHLVALDEGRE
jgi:hypothetical protein